MSCELSQCLNKNLKQQIVEMLLWHEQTGPQTSGDRKRRFGDRKRLPAGNRCRESTSGTHPFGAQQVFAANFPSPFYFSTKLRSQTCLPLVNVRLACEPRHQVPELQALHERIVLHIED